MNRQKNKPFKLSLIAVICIFALFNFCVSFLMTSCIFVETVEVVKPTRGDIVCTVEESGEVQACNRTDIFAAQPASIVSVPVAIGQNVFLGQVLVTMENYDLEIQKGNAGSQMAEVNASASNVSESMASTRLDLKEAEKDLERTKALYEAGAVSEADYSKALLKVNSLKQVLAQQETSLKNYQEQAAIVAKVMAGINNKAKELEVVSPVSGVILQLPAKPYQVVNAGSLLASVGTPDLLEIKADILEDEMANVKVGQEVGITSQVLGSRILKGFVKQIYPQAEEKTSTLGVVQRRVPVIISMTETANLKPGYEVHVSIETDKRKNVLTIPMETVRTLENGQKQVLVIEDGHIRFRTIQTGISDKFNIEIVNGLYESDMVVRDAGLKLGEWQKVKPQF
ncbi:MAG: efflux RND transporter periplasmic adaptor subunit [Bacillota bacterium]